GYIMSSFGAGELGLHLCFETPATIAIRRASIADRGLARALFGTGSTPTPAPMVLTFNPLRTFIEIVDPDASGFGALTISMLDPAQPIPLLRYQTGDVARLLDRELAGDLVRQARTGEISGLPDHLVALRGRSKEALPNGCHVGVYKDALYSDPAAATHVTGAFRVEFSGEACTLHVQLAGSEIPPSLEPGIVAALPPAARPSRVIFWPYGRFPFGMTLDYERKFTYYAPEPSPD
ncbi:MAG: hypothetical protein ACRD1U_07750, partial [Vicinamibacterales bacterium]